jgi:hypothetical protein
METNNDNYWVRQISKKRKPWFIRNIWWFILGIAFVLAIMLLTNPKDSFKHNRAVINSAEKKIYPALIAALQQDRMTNIQSQSEDNKHFLQATWSLFEGLFGSGLGTSFATSIIADKLSVNEVSDHYIYSIGYHDKKMITIGLFGHVWTIYDFMSESKIASEILERLKER